MTPSVPLDPEVVLLRELLASDSGFVSGTALARRLGLSRVAVWGHMEKLRRAGFRFEAAPRRGYRLLGTPAGWQPWLIQARLRARDGHRLVWRESVGSTNDEAERELAAGRPAPFVVLAARQTAGRGRFGRVWHSDDPGNLYASFAFRPAVRAVDLQTFTLWMGLAVCDCLATTSRIVPGIKWPNDLVFDGRKLGGMLTEARIDADRTRDLVFGLGLNVNGDPAGWPPALAARATSLRAAAGRSLDLNHLAAALIQRVLHACERFVEDPRDPRLLAAWSQYDALASRPVSVHDGRTTIEGIAEGIDTDGALLVRTASGQVHRFHAAEVTLARPAEGVQRPPV